MVKVANGQGESVAGDMQYVELVHEDRDESVAGDMQ